MDIKHDVWNNFLLHKKKVFRKTQELVQHPVSNIGKILPIITSVCHLVCGQKHCYGMQISCYHINTLLSTQFPHLHGQTGVNFFSKCRLNSHTCLNLWPSLETYSFLFITSAFIHFILTAHYLYSFSRFLFLVRVFLCLFLLLVYFCISFLRALPSHTASTYCASYFPSSTAWGKWDIIWLRCFRGTSQIPGYGSSFPRLPCCQDCLLLHLQGMQFSHPLLRSTSSQKPTLLQNLPNRWYWHFSVQFLKYRAVRVG